MSGGVATALGEALKNDATMEEMVQQGLFEELEPEETGDLAAPSPLLRAIEPPRRKPGRPKGSRNRRTEAVQAWLLSQHAHPLKVLMQAYSTPVVQFAAELGLQPGEDGRFDNDTLIELAKLQYRLATDCLPYVAQKMPQAVQVDAAANLSISFGGVNLAGGVSDPARAGSPEISVGDGMSVRLGQVGRNKSDDDLAD